MKERDFIKLDKSPPILYDITRLVTRGLNNTPNGIDRIDFSLAKNFLSQEYNQNKAFIYTLSGPCLVPNNEAIEVIDLIEHYWGEHSAENEKLQYEKIKLIINSTDTQHKNRISFSDHLSQKKISINLHALLKWAIRIGPGLDSAPKGAIYFNASQFLLNKDWFEIGVLKKKNIKSVFYLHDLIAIDQPEYFLQEEVNSFEKKLKNIVSYGQGIICGSKSVLERYKYYKTDGQSASQRHFVYHPNTPSAFETKINTDNSRFKSPFFVMCGTVEPRKNNLRILHLWEELAATQSAPKLIIVGKRGWLNEEISALIERSPRLQSLILEVEGLSTPALARLLQEARALIAPSFIEGFGLPVAEAISAEVPILASDIEVFREIGHNSLDYINPIDGLGWLKAIRDYSEPSSVRRKEALAKIKEISAAARQSNFVDLLSFINSL
jgi:glycosyltransferase involved in cell wall biosynthesis